MSTLAEQLAELRREIALREQFFPKWIASRKITQAAADDRLWRMRDALETLEALEAMPELADAVAARISAGRAGDVADIKRELAADCVDQAREAGL
jgi:hypothetical protein